MVGTALRQRGIGKCGDCEEGQRSLLRNGDAIDRQVIADGIFPPAKTAFRLGASRECLHGDFMIRAETRDKRWVDGCCFLDCFLVPVLDHVGLREIESRS
jgi:hypothetical protein